MVLTPILATGIGTNVEAGSFSSAALVNATGIPTTEGAARRQ